MAQVNFGSMTKLNFKINSNNQKALSLKSDYDKQFSIFEQAKKAQGNAPAGADASASSVNPSDLKKAMEDAQKKLISIETMLEKEIKNAPADDKDKEKKTESGNFSGMA